MGGLDKWLDEFQERAGMQKLGVPTEETATGALMGVKEKRDEMARARDREARPLRLLWGLRDKLQDLMLSLVEIEEVIRDGDTMQNDGNIPRDTNVEMMGELVIVHSKLYGVTGSGGCLREAFDNILSVMRDQKKYYESLPAEKCGSEALRLKELYAEW